MSKPLDDGGPAFPQPQAWPMTSTYGGHGGGWYSAPPLMPIQQGMSLRDWFAGQFLAGAAADSSALDVSSSADQFDIDAAMTAHWEAVSRAAYIAAEAMLKERTRRSEPEGE